MYSFRDRRRLATSTLPLLLRRVLLATAVATSAATSACDDKPKFPNEVRAAALSAGLLGQSVSGATSALEEIGRTSVPGLTVTGFIPYYRELHFEVPDPAKQWFPKRRVHGWVTFDSGGRAIAVEVHYSVDDPL